MKKLVLVLFVGLLGAGFTANAQSVDLKLNLLPLLFGQYGINADFNINDDMSVGVTGKYFNYGGDNSGGASWSGLNFTGNYRFYFNSDRSGANGFFVSPYAKFRTVKQEGLTYFDSNNETQTTTRKNTGLAFGVVTGNKWVARSGFVFELFGGFGKFAVDKYSYDSQEAEDYYADVDNFLSGSGLPSLDFRFGAAIGWRLGN